MDSENSSLKEKWTDRLRLLVGNSPEIHEIGDFGEPMPDRFRVTDLEKTNEER